MKLCGFEVGLDRPFFLIAGPCVVESEQLQIDTAATLKEITADLGINFIFKSSFDKANRTSLNSFRGPGMEEGLRVLATVEDEPSAIQALRELPVDILILDLELKVGTGFGVLEALGTGRPPTIVMTNYALPQYRDRARKLGVEHFLNKAMDFDRLPEIVAGIRAGRN